MRKSTLIQPATSSIESPHSPWIPPELVSLILTKLWEERLSSDERASLLQNIVLVNRTWLTLVAPIASRDVHLFDKQHASAFLGSIPKHSYHRSLFSNEASQFVNEACHSITFHIDGNLKASRSGLAKATPAVWETSQIDEAIGLVLDMVTGFPQWLPNLRHMSFQYTDWAYDDIFEQMRWEYVPKQVTHLSVDYSFSDPASVPAFESATTLRWSDWKNIRWFWNIKRCSFSGMSTGLVAAFFRMLACSNVETLEIAHPVQLAALASLPPRIHTLVLCHPGIAISKNTMESWALDTALGAGIFGEGIKPRIVVRSGTPDPVAFIGLARTCKDFNAELVYERDDVRRRGC